MRILYAKSRSCLLLDLCRCQELLDEGFDFLLNLSVGGDIGQLAAQGGLPCPPVSFKFGRFEEVGPITECYVLVLTLGQKDILHRRQVKSSSLKLQQVPDVIQVPARLLLRRALSFSAAISSRR